MNFNWNIHAFVVINAKWTFQTSDDIRLYVRRVKNEIHTSHGSSVEIWLH